MPNIILIIISKFVLGVCSHVLWHSYLKYEFLCSHVEGPYELFKAILYYRNYYLNLRISHGHPVV